MPIGTPPGKSLLTRSIVVAVALGGSFRGRFRRLVMPGPTSGRPGARPPVEPNVTRQFTMSNPFRGHLKTKQILIIQKNNRPTVRGGRPGPADRGQGCGFDDAVQQDHAVQWEYDSLSKPRLLHQRHAFSYRRRKHRRPYRQGDAGANLSQDVPPLRWDVPPDIEKVGRPSHPPLKVWDRRLRTSRFKFTVTVAPACPLRLLFFGKHISITSPLRR